MQTDIRKVIENSHLFTGLRRDLIDEIELSVTRKRLGADEILFQKGDSADALWGVLSGRIVVDVRTDDGKEMVLDAFGEGEVFGEVGLQIHYLSLPACDPSFAGASFAGASSSGASSSGASAAVSPDAVAFGGKLSWRFLRTIKMLNWSTF